MPPEELGKFIVKLNEANIATRYPESLEKLQKTYTKTIAATSFQTPKRHWHG